MLLKRSYLVQSCKYKSFFALAPGIFDIAHGSAFSSPSRPLGFHNWTANCSSLGVSPSRQEATHLWSFSYSQQSISQELTMQALLFILLILLLIGALPTWPYSTGWGYYPSGGLGLVVLILLILVLMGRI